MVYFTLQLNEQNKNLFNRSSTLRTLSIIVTLFLSSSLNSQSNPWETSPSENPWGEQAKTTKVPQSGDTVLQTKKVETVNPVYLSYTRKRELQSIGADNYNATASFVGSMITASFINFLALPVNLLTSFTPNRKTQKAIDNYKYDHPNATRNELKEIKKGTRGKRAIQAGWGTLAGMGVNILAFLIMLTF